MKGRPLGIWVITFLQVLLALSLLVSVVTGVDLFSQVQGQRLEDAPRLIYVLWVAITAVAGVLLWRLSRRGWVLTMVLTGVSLAANLASWWLGDANFLRMGVQVMVAFYLNSAPVRELFMERSEVSRITLRATEGP